MVHVEGGGGVRRGNCKKNNKKNIRSRCSAIIIKGNLVDVDSTEKLLSRIESKIIKFNEN